MKPTKLNLKVKLVCAFIYKDQDVLEKAKRLLKKQFGRIDFESGELDFDCAYYQAEMGEGLKRKFVSFTRPIPIEELYRIKLFTNRLEEKFLSQGKRRVNIDPGYLDQAKLVLATTKDFAHRIYLRKGIFAEITLSFKDGAYRPHEWTYPDYRSKEYADIFNQIRQLYQPHA